MRQSEFEFQIQVHGHPIREYFHEGRTYIEGRKGSEYKLHVKNHSAFRVLAVVTVDGLSVMDGSEGHFDGSGYVLAPHESIAIPGWRLDNSEVAKFVFGSKPDSYAAQTDRPQNVGVIGCAIFREVRPPEPTVIYRDRWVYPPWPYDRPWYPRPWRPYEPLWHSSGTIDSSSVTFSDASMLRSCSMGASVANSAPQSIGTEFGAPEQHRVREVGFNREPSTTCVFEVWYDDRRGLEARGIDLRGGLTVGRPTAFPRSGGCKPPRGWLP